MLQPANLTNPNAAGQSMAGVAGGGITGAGTEQSQPPIDWQGASYVWQNDQSIPGRESSRPDVFGLRRRGAGLRQGSGSRTVLAMHGQGGGSPENRGPRLDKSGIDVPGLRRAAPGVSATVHDLRPQETASADTQQGPKPSQGAGVTQHGILPPCQIRTYDRVLGLPVWWVGFSANCVTWPVLCVFEATRFSDLGRLAAGVVQRFGLEGWMNPRPAATPTPPQVSLHLREPRGRRLLLLFLRPPLSATRPVLAGRALSGRGRPPQNWLRRALNLPDAPPTVGPSGGPGQGPDGPANNSPNRGGRTGESR